MQRDIEISRFPGLTSGSFRQFTLDEFPVPSSPSLSSFSIGLYRSDPYGRLLEPFFAAAAHVGVVCKMSLTLEINFAGDFWLWLQNPNQMKTFRIQFQVERLVSLSIVVNWNINFSGFEFDP